MRAPWSSVSSWNRDTIPGFQNPAGKFIRHALGPRNCTRHRPQRTSMGTERCDYAITAEYGQPLNAARHEPTDTGTVLSAVILVPAMATPTRHYYPLADWFTQQGYVVHTFDYQGYGASARTPLTEVEADILTWADDAAVMLDHVAE